MLLARAALPKEMGSGRYGSCLTKKNCQCKEYQSFVANIIILKMPQTEECFTTKAFC